MTSESCRIGTRKSALATTQSTLVMELLRARGVACELVLIESEGDRDRTTPLYDINSPSPGLFTKHLETALLEGRIDLAVHSLKDLPTQQPPELHVACIPPRVAANDCLLVHPDAFSPHSDALPLRGGAKVGTSSLRREAELLSLRRDLDIVPIRGNVPTRVQAVRDGRVEAVVLAEAGLFRLGLKLDDLIKIALPADIFVPAPGQGALAVEVRSSAETHLLQALAQFHDPAAATEVSVERRILRELEGGCTLPLGVRAAKVGENFELNAFLGILSDRKGKLHEWISFHRFHFVHADEQLLIRKAVEFFRDKLDGSKQHER